MGMMINRRRVCGGKDDTYIQDGLVFWLDGINKGDNPTAWTDLIGGYTFPYSEGAVIESDGVANIYSQSVQEAFDARANTYTVEGVSNYCSNRWGILLYGKKPGDVVLANGGGIITTGNINSRSRTFKTNLSTPTTVSCHADFLMLNGNIHTYTGNDSWNTGYSGKFIIGGRSGGGGGSYKNTSKIYSIRIYNRQLTEEEMLHNQRIDNVRFNLGLNI